MINDPYNIQQNKPMLVVYKPDDPENTCFSYPHGRNIMGWALFWMLYGSFLACRENIGYPTYRQEEKKLGRVGT